MALWGGARRLFMLPQTNYAKRPFVVAALGLVIAAFRLNFWVKTFGVVLRSLGFLTGRHF